MWYGVVCYGVYGVVWNGIVWYVWYGVVWYGVYGVVWKARGGREKERMFWELLYRSSPHKDVKKASWDSGGIILAALWRGLPGGVGGARNLINNMGCEYPARSGGACLERWEGHET